MKHSIGSELDVSRETAARLTVFVELLLKWNLRINLISRKDEACINERHLKDALQLLPLMPVSLDQAIDLGSGCGIPGLVLAIASNVHFTLVEADKRKAAFLREAVRATTAGATVLAERVEDIRCEPARLITARAFAPLAKLLEIAEPLLAPGAILLLPKGENVDHELTDALAGWNMQTQKISSQTKPGSFILRVSEVSRA